MNQITITGNLGRDPELNYTSSGKAVTKFSVAVTDGYGDKKTTTWFNIVAWDKMAENMNNFLQKGKKVLISGKLSIRKYTGKDGIERQAVEIIARDFEMLSPKAERETEDDGFDPLGGLEDHPF